MVTSAADSSSNNHTPTTNPAATNNTPNFPRKNLTSPWAQIVRGADSEPLNNQSPPPPPPQSSSASSSSSSSLDSANLVAAIAVDNSNADKNNNAGNPKKPAWKNASNGVVSEVSPVMGAVSWPALSAKSSAAKLTSDSSAAAAEGSISIPQGPITSNSSHKQATSTTNANANTKSNPPMNHSVANRQKPMKRGGGNNNSNEPVPFPSSFSNPPHVNNQPSVAPPPYPVVQIPPNTGFADGVQSYRNNNGWSPRSPVGGYGLPVDEHRNPSRRGNYGNRPHNNYGNRRNQDPGNIVNTRDPHAHQHRMHSGGFLRPALPNSPYLGSQPMRPFVNTFGFHEFYYYPTLQFEQFGGMPFLTHPPPPAMFFPVAETVETSTETPSTTHAEIPLTYSILKQIEYYFSDVNLANDKFLKFNMDEHGWVPITLIANFPRVKTLTSNIELILDSLRTSKVVEVHGDKLRRRMASADEQQQVSSGPVSPSGSSYNNIVADFDKITMDEATAHKISNATTNVGSAEQFSHSLGSIYS